MRAAGLVPLDTGTVRSDLSVMPAPSERSDPIMHTPDRPALRRSRTDRALSGALAGTAHYFRLDPFRLRLAFVVVSILSAGFPGILAYLALWYVIPDER